jgi:hypothetical protein
MTTKDQGQFIWIHEQGDVPKILDSGDEARARVKNDAEP